MNFRSEVRESTINDRLDKAKERNYGQYLARMILKKIRGFTDEPVSFDFSVTAIIGPNGRGKTTVLGAAACAYQSAFPRKFFAKSGKYDAAMSDWSIEYELLQRDLVPKDVVRRTASLKSLKWNRHALKRPAIVFDVLRTVPASERKELLRCASNKFTVADDKIKNFSDGVCEHASRILGKDIKEFKETQISQKGHVTLLRGSTSSGEGYSEFHFGAGESSVIRMVSSIESCPDQSIVLIEEIENGLHPVATVRLVEYLILAAERKNIQVIFTIHSNEALKAIPDKAVWSATQDRLTQGKLDIKSLYVITGRIDTEIVIFVEDEFTKSWLEAILRQGDEQLIKYCEIYVMGGDGRAVAMNTYHNSNPPTKTPSICFIDGDSKHHESEENRVYRIPGQTPETFIFDSVIAAWDEIGGKLSVMLLQKYENADKLLELCKNTRITNKKIHIIYSQIGEKLSLLPERTARDAFTTIWSQKYSDDVTQMIAKIRLAIDQAPSSKLSLLSQDTLA